MFMIRRCQECQKFLGIRFFEWGYIWKRRKAWFCETTGICQPCYDTIVAKEKDKGKAVENLMKKFTTKT